MDEVTTSLILLSISLNRFSPIRKVEVGIVNKPATSPAAVVFNLPIEYTELFATGVVDQEDEIVATL